VIVVNSGTKSWWKRKRWWATVAGLVIIAVSFERCVSNRAQAIENLREDMRARAVNGPGPPQPVPCVTDARTGEEHCSKPRLLIPCQTQIFIDPFEIWMGRGTRDELRSLAFRKFEELGGLEQLAQWFACQGFKVSYADDHLFASIRTPDGYGPFSANGLIQILPAWADTVSMGYRHGELRMDIGTTRL
jgi:hypothetical protein